MIDYTEKGAGLHEAIRAAGHWLVDRDGVWVASDDTAVQAIIDGYTLADARVPVITAIKEEARRRILAFLPDWKQSNFNAQINEFNDARWSRSLTPQETAQLEYMRSQWERAKAIRAASDAKEAALQTWADVINHDMSAGWPE